MWEYLKANIGRITENEVREFMRKKPIPQAFAPRPKSDGKIFAAGPLTDWALDSIDLRGRTKLGAAFRYILIAQNTFTGYIFMAPMKSNSNRGPHGTAALFEKMLDKSARLTPPQGPPSALTSDSFEHGKGGNPEWQGAFQTLLNSRHIVHRMKQKEHVNAMGKIDSTIRHVKALLFRGLAEDARVDWVAKLPEILETYNKRLGHEGSFGSTPDQVLKDPLLEFQVQQQNARSMEVNHKQHLEKKVKVLEEGHFRVALKPGPMKGDNEPRWSGEVHTLGDQDRAAPYIRDSKGALWNPSLIKSVPPGSKSVKLSKIATESNRGVKDLKRTQIYPWAKRIHKNILDKYNGQVSVNNNAFSKYFKEQDAFFLAMKLARVTTAKDKDAGTSTYRPMAVIALFPRYFRVKNRVIHAVGEMPKDFVPSDDDDVGVSDDEEDVPVEKKVPVRMQLKLALIEELRAAGGEGSTDDSVLALRAKLRAAKIPRVIETPVPR